MYELKMVNLENCFNMAVAKKVNYVAVVIEMDGFDEKEIIINPIRNAVDKLEYYNKTYNDDLTHKYSNGIRIVGCTYGNNFADIEFDLIGE